MPRSHPSHDLTLRLDAMTYGGAALGRVDGKAIFVTGGLPGEVVRVTVEEDTRPLCARPSGRSDRAVARSSDAALSAFWLGLRLVRRLPLAAHRLCRAAALQDGHRARAVAAPWAAYPIRRCATSSPARRCGSIAITRNFMSRRMASLGFQAARSHRVVPIDECFTIAPPLQEWLHGTAPG